MNVLQACFSEVLATPALEFMLVSNAVRLAQSKGLHLKARKSWKLSEKEIAFRNTLWWTIYSIDKHLCFRSGRPSVRKRARTIKASQLTVVGYQ